MKKDITFVCNGQDNTHLLRDVTKAKNELGWVPKYGFKRLVSEMLGIKHHNLKG